MPQIKLLVKKLGKQILLTALTSQAFVPGQCVAVNNMLAVVDDPNGNPVLTCTDKGKGNFAITVDISKSGLAIR